MLTITVLNNVHRWAARLKLVLFLDGLKWPLAHISWGSKLGTVKIWMERLSFLGLFYVHSIDLLPGLRKRYQQNLKIIIIRHQPHLLMLGHSCPKLSAPNRPGGGTQIIFWRGVRPEVWNPYPYLRIFLPQKTADLKLFFEIFANRDPFLRVFLPQNGWFYHFFAIFCEMGPSSKDLFD